MHRGLDDGWKKGGGGHSGLEVLRRSLRVVKTGHSVSHKLSFLEDSRKSDLPL